MSTVIKKLPEWVKRPLRRIKRAVNVMFYYGKARFCPVCENTSRRFNKHGIQLRDDARCPHCGALERHRLFWLFIQKKTTFFDGAEKVMLHVAPEPMFESKFKKLLGSNYISADLFNPRAMVKMDITDIQYPGESFDVIYCSHVLEHVHDDKKAMREFYRVLKKDGWAILLVPIRSKKTFEDSTVTDPIERTRIFGQADHIRNYGLDYVDRLGEAGFTVQTTKITDLVSSKEAAKMGLKSHGGSIFYCTKN